MLAEGWGEFLDKCDSPLAPLRDALGDNKNYWLVVPSCIHDGRVGISALFIGHYDSGDFLGELANEQEAVS